MSVDASVAVAVTVYTQPPEDLINLLQAHHRPYALPLLRRLRFTHFPGGITEHTRILFASAPGLKPATTPKTPLRSRIPRPLARPRDRDLAILITRATPRHPRVRGLRRQERRGVSSRVRVLHPARSQGHPRGVLRPWDATRCGTKTRRAGCASG